MPAAVLRVGVIASTHGPSLLAIIALTSCAPRTQHVVPDRVPDSPSARAIVDRAVVALGGAARIASVRTLTVEGSGTTRSFGQSVVPGSDLPIVDVSHRRRTIDLANGRWREQLTQARRPPSPNTIPVTYSFGIADAIAYTIDDDGSAALDPPAVAKERRAELLHHPLCLLRATLGQSAVLTNARRSHGRDLVDIATADGPYTLAIDVSTGLVASVASLIDDPILGDVEIETGFGDYQPTGGLMLPTELAERRDGTPVASFAVRSQIDSAADSAAAPEGLPREPPAVPAVTIEPVAEGVWLLGGSSHHSVLVEVDDRALLIEAPQDEARALAVIAAASTVLRAKPLTHVILSHHHHDHAAGVRTAVAEGLVIVAHIAARPFVEDLVARRHTIAQDELARRPRPLALETVADHRTYGASPRSIELYPVSGNAHAATLLMVYVPHAHLLITTDLFDRSSTGAFPFAANLVDNVDRIGLQVDTLIGLHGRPVPFREVRAAATKASATSSFR